MKNIFVGNLHSETTAESIRSFFAPAGAVRKIKLMLDRKTGLSRGFAFIEMAEAEADRAIATLHGKVLDGQIIHIHEGRQKVHGLASPERLIRKDAAPDLRLSLTATGQDSTEATLTIEDSGPGLPAGLDLSRAETMGYQLIHLLVRQLRARLDIAPGPGTRITASFPIAGTPGG